ncbi:MAG: hypothetical protein GC164_03185 [Phycisphaera sp.]|nr:hypothetical protein [Phycisphaera sp.]
MTPAIKQFVTLVGKDLRIEARSRQTLGLVCVLGVLILVVLGLGLGRETVRSGAASTAALWVAYLFGGVLTFEKTMAVERQDSALAGLLMAPVDRGVLYLAKLTSNLLLMAVLAVVVTLVGVLLLSFDLGAAPLGFIVIITLGMVGFASVGTLFAAAVSSTRLQGGLLALVIFPICLPLVIASTRMMVNLFETRVGEPASSLGGSGLAILIAFDAIYLVTSWLVFELLLEP